jgi:hypothetical protein
MTDHIPQNTDATTHPAPQHRLFKIGSVVIAEDEALRGLSVEAVRTLLRPAYPEVAHTLVRERVEGETLILEFVAQAGRKG